MTEPAHLSQVDALLGARPRSRTRRRIGIGLLLLALAAAATLLLRFMEGNTTPYYMLPLARGDLRARLDLVGAVRLADAPVAVSAPWDGVMGSAPAAVGTVVAVGQTLASLADPTIEHTLATDRAQLAAARSAQVRAGVAAQAAALRLARFEAVWRESQHRVPSLDEMDRARADAARSALDVRRARVLRDAAWRRLRADLARRGDAVLRAPVGGVVASSVAAPGSWVHAGQAVLELAPSDAALQLVAPVAEAAGPLAAGAAAQVQLGAGHAVRGATLLRVERDVAGGRRAVFALAPGVFVPPGTAAHIELQLPPRRHVLLVPDAALAFARPCAMPSGRASLWIWTRDGSAREVPIVTGPGDGQHTEIVAGAVQPGDLAIIGWKSPPPPERARPSIPATPTTAPRSARESSKP